MLNGQQERIKCVVCEGKGKLFVTPLDDQINAVPDDSIEHSIEVVESGPRVSSLWRRLRDVARETKRKEKIRELLPLIRNMKQAVRPLSSRAAFRATWLYLNFGQWLVLDGRMTNVLEEAFQGGLGAVVHIAGENLE